ncbi:hypothetical protein COCOBI_01-8670 [Coccomyxa sp. Obi]|nr:hypothetical protein COCOBI_01-8670 [Coccomyxa sp. Obi]
MNFLWSLWKLACSPFTWFAEWLRGIVRGEITTALAAERELINEKFEQISKTIASTTASSITRSASKLKPSELDKVEKALNVIFLPPYGDKTLLPDLKELGEEFSWNPRDSEPTHTRRAIRHVNDRLNIPPGAVLIDANRGPAATGNVIPVTSVYGLAFHLKAKTDLLMVIEAMVAKATRFAFIGVELKKSLSDESLTQARAQYLAWGLHAHSAYMQVLTDLRRGGWSAGWKLRALSPASSDGSSYEGTPTLYSEELLAPRRFKLRDPGQR